MSATEKAAIKLVKTHNHDITYLGISATATDSSKWNGKAMPANVDGVLHNDGAGVLSWLAESTFATADHIHDGSDHNHDSTYLGITAKAADSDKLDGMQPATANTVSTIVQRDASGNFNAGTITATFSGNLTGNVTGNVSGSSGSCTGNAATATTATQWNSKAMPANVDGILHNDGAGTLSWLAESTFATSGHNHNTTYLGINAKAADSDLLDGHDTEYFATANHDHNTAYLGISAQAVDSDKLDGMQPATANTVSTIVQRDASGNFSAGTITATFSGNLTGNVTGNTSGSSGSCTGNAATATTATQWNGKAMPANVDGILHNNGAGALSWLAESTFATSGHNHDAAYVNVGGDSMIGDLNMGSNQITNLGVPSEGSDAVTKDYVDQKIQGLDWQESVKDKDLTAPPVSPTVGDRYLIAANPTGTWAGHAGNIVEWDGDSWLFVTPDTGTAVMVEDETAQYTYNGSAWITFGSTVNHNALSSLQGGQADEYNHLTNAQRTDVANATNANTVSTIVKRDSSGNFNAGTITATFSGNLTGNVTGNTSGSSGSCTGNAATATNSTQWNSKAMPANVDGILHNDGAGTLSWLAESTFATSGHNHNSTYLGIGAKAADSDLLDGHDTGYFATADHNHNSTYLGISATAADSTKWNNKAMPANVDGILHNDGAGTLSWLAESSFATSGHNHNAAYLGISAKAADSNLLDGHDTGYFATADHNHNAAYLGISAQATDSDKLDGMQPATANTVSTIVQRDSSGNFSAGTITATFSGNLTGNVTGNATGSSGSCTGNAATATTATQWNGKAMPANVDGVLHNDGTGTLSWLAESTFATSGHNHDSTYLGISAKAADSDKLDGHDTGYFATADHNHNTTYLGINATAANSTQWNGKAMPANVDGILHNDGAGVLSWLSESTFATSGHNHDSTYLGISAKAADSDKLDGMQPATTNTVSTIVQRDANGDFAARTITANLTGNASGSSGSCTGNAATASSATTATQWNGKAMPANVDGILHNDGAGALSWLAESTFAASGHDHATSISGSAAKWTTARTVTLGGDLTGNVNIDGSANVTLTATVTDDSHTHDGRYYTETELNTSGGAGQVHWDRVQSKPASYPGNCTGSSASCTGNAATATSATTATQWNSKAMPANVDGILHNDGAGALSWLAESTFATSGHNHNAAYLGISAQAADSDKLDGMQPATANTVSTIVQRDASGNFSAGTITANLTGNASGSSGSCTGNAATATTATQWNGKAMPANVDGILHNDGAGALSWLAESTFATSGHNHNSTYMALGGGTFTGDVSMGDGVPSYVTDLTTAPVRMDTLNFQHKGGIAALWAVSGQKDHIYRAHNNSTYTISSTGGGSVNTNDLFTNDLAVDCYVDVTQLPWVLTITCSGQIEVTDVLNLVVLHHRHSPPSFNWKDYTVEIQKVSDSTWMTVLARTGVNDNYTLEIPLYYKTDATNYVAIKGIRITVNEADKASFHANSMAIARLMIVNSRTIGGAAEGIGALDLAGGTLYGSLTLATGTVTAPAFSGPLTGNVTGNCTGSSGSCTGAAASATTATQWNGKAMPANVDGILHNDGTGTLSWLAESTFAASGHDHDTRYYTETELNTSGGAGQVHWDRVQSKPASYPGNCTGSSASCTGNAATATNSTQWNSKAMPANVDGILHNDGAGALSWLAESTFAASGHDHATSINGSAAKWTTARTITLGTDLSGSVNIDGSANVTLNATVVDDSHTHDGRYYTETELNTSGGAGQVHWDRVQSKPASYPGNCTGSSASCTGAAASATTATQWNSKAMPANSAGALTNDGSGTLSWTPAVLGKVGTVTAINGTTASITFEDESTGTARIIL